MSDECIAPQRTERKRKTEGKNNECFIKALPSRSLTQMIIGARRPSANEAEMRAGRRKASTRALHLCVRLRVPLHSNECR